VTQAGSAPLGKAGGGKPVGRAWSLRVVDSFDLTPRMRRVRLTADDLDALDHLPGQELVLAIPSEGGEPARRHLTISALDRASRTLDIDFVLHGHGPAGLWARAAKPGDSIAAVGPRGRITAATDADWHLFSGDETCIPAIFAIIRALPRSAKAFVFFEIDGPEERQTLDAAAELHCRWLFRDGAPPGPSRILFDALQAFELPTGRGHAYIIGETSNVRAQRQRLLERGLIREQISAEGYWRPDRIGGHDHVTG
jgi:NADPH-dependent ferric siderophore reductase